MTSHQACAASNTWRLQMRSWAAAQSLLKLACLAVPLTSIAELMSEERLHPEVTRQGGGACCLAGAECLATQMASHMRVLSMLTCRQQRSSDAVA